MPDARFLDGERFFEKDKIPIYVDSVIHDATVDVHAHRFYEFVYIDQGFSTHYCNGVTSILTPGDVFGIRPGDVHGYTWPKQTVLYNCLFYPEALGPDLHHIANLPGPDRILCADGTAVWQRVHLDPLVRKEVLGYLRNMKEERARQRLGWELKLKSLLVAFLIAVSRSSAKQHRGEDSGEYRYTKHIHQALAYMEDHYDRPVQVETLADLVGLSADYFSRLFKQLTGLTPMEYSKHIRLAKASELLVNPTRPIADVAAQVGFDDPSYFARQFKQVLGMSPSQFQKQAATQVD